MRHLRIGALLEAVVCLFEFTATVHAQQSAADKLKSKIAELQFDLHMWHEYPLSNAFGAGPYFAIGGSTVLSKNELTREA